MMQVSKLSRYTALFLSVSALFAYYESFFLGTAFAWIAAIQLMNALAPKLPFPRLFHWTHAMTFELFALLGVAALRLTPHKHEIRGSGRPILLVHGYINHGSVWTLFKRRLEALQFGPIYTINLGHPFRSISSYAEIVKAKAEEIAKVTGRKDLVLIGHSMGGLVSALYAAKLSSPNTVTDVITIGSPLNGTPIAYLGLGPNAKEMRPRSNLLKEMREVMANRKDIRFFHLATKSDQLVIPGSSAIFPENQHFLFEDLGHASLLYSKRAQAQIAKWLAD